MGQTAPNSGPVTHVFDGIFRGYCLVVHQGNVGLEKWSGDAQWPAFRAVLLAARSAPDAMLDEAATAAWGGWWAAEVVARGLRPAMRVALANHFPPHLLIP
jgi:hypothetical protein